jgi:hypothetical protein
MVLSMAPEQTSHRDLLPELCYCCSRKRVVFLFYYMLVITCISSVSTYKGEASIADQSAAAKVRALKAVILVW